tara:strand:+ start:77 stop:325 length:249 start_codon:yes stop_codon:yes gene_type:complete
MRRNLDPTVMQSKTAGEICKLAHSMQKEIKRLSLSNDRANEVTKTLLRKSASLLKIREAELRRVSKNTETGRENNTIAAGAR